MVDKCTNKTVKEVIETIRRNKTMIDSKDLFESRHINTQNGILDPKTFELKPHSPEYYTTSKLPFSVDHNARNPKLWNHILTIIDVKDLNLIMELIWICISNNNPFKKMFVFKGPTNAQNAYYIRRILNELKLTRTSLVWILIFQLSIKMNFG